MSLTITTALLTIATLQFESSVHFYTQLLQQKPIVFHPASYAEFQLPGLRLGIFRPRPGSLVAPFRSGMGLCLEVNSLEAAIAHLGAIAHPVVGDIRVASHGREIDIYDPDGNWLILHQGATSG